MARSRSERGPGAGGDGCGCGSRPPDAPSPSMAGACGHSSSHKGSMLDFIVEAGEMPHGPRAGGELP